MRAILSTLGVAAAMLAVSGCCEPRCAQPQPAYPSVVMPLLSDGVPPHPAASRTSIALRASGKPEELVYDLGDGLIANSNAVKLAGGRTAPLARYRQGGVGCAPAAAQNPSTFSAPALRVALPAQPAAAAPAPTVGMVYGACPVPEGSEQVCLPGEFISECFTLTDTEKQNGPAIYIPGTFSKYDARLDATAPIEPAALPAIDSTASATPAVAALAEPASTLAIPAAPGVEPAEKSDALRQVESLEKAESPLAAPVPAPEVAPTTTAPLAPPMESSEPVAVMPPVPVVSDLNQVADSMPPSGDASNLPEVVLPPKLN